MKKNWKTTVAGLVSLAFLVLRIMGVEVPMGEVAGHIISNTDVASASAAVGAIFAADASKQ